MKTKSLFFLALILFFIQSYTINKSSADVFQIVFTADPQNQNLTGTWLDEVKGEWGATGISLWVSWEDIESSKNNFNWNVFDSQIALIQSKGINNVYIRAVMFRTPGWLENGVFQNDDFQLLKNDTPYILYGRKCPNFASPTSINHMKRFYTELLTRLNYLKGIHPNLIIKEVVPSTNQDIEMEYTHSVMLGYSTHEKQKFQEYLIEKYSNNINILNQRWEVPIPNYFTYFTDIDPKDYNWDERMEANTIYQYRIGRSDWINFKTKLLKSFVDELAEITHTSNFKMGLQLGSIYDNNIEFRGWYDPTSLFENVDAIRTADLNGYKPNFDFAADYQRSICDFWNRQPGNNVQHTFSTESNKPYFENQDPVILSNDWTTQLEAYKNKGADAHFIVQWDRSDLPMLQGPFSIWKQTLQSNSGNPLTTVSYNKAVHLSCEQGYFKPNVPYWVGGIYALFEFSKSVMPWGDYITNQNNYNNDADIITNYMIIKDPTYISSYYDVLNFTESSYYIPEQVYVNLMRTDNSVIWMNNATHFSNNGNGEFDVTHGLRNEYNHERSPIHLIWRSRPDLQAVWPDANLHIQGWDQDFIYWAVHYGAGIEYPEWDIIIPGATQPPCMLQEVFKYDGNLKSVWNSRADLQGIYCDGHYRSYGSYPPNMISWAKQYGYLESTLLTQYEYWPYIGGCYGINCFEEDTKTSITGNPRKFFLYKNYPNPFNPITNIKFDIPKSSIVKILIYDILGKEIAVLINEKMNGGTYEVNWDASAYPSGVYFYKLVTDDFTESKKMVLVK